MHNFFSCLYLNRVESKKTNSLQPNFNAIHVTTTPKSSRNILVLRKSTIDYIMSILVLEYKSILQIIEGDTTTTATNDKHIEYKMKLGCLTMIILI
jgi:hypothetical protein